MTHGSTGARCAGGRCQAAAIDQIDKLLKQQPPQNPELIAAMAKLDLEKQDRELRDKELNIRAAREEGDLDIRRGKDKASEISLAVAGDPEPRQCQEGGR